MPLAGLLPVQLRFASGNTSEDYVTRQAWLSASLLCCPLHPKGGCGFARHGTYRRVTPAGTLIPRWYCPQGHCTFSLLPDHLAARFPGTLDEIERVVDTVDQAKSLEAAADLLRPDCVSLISAVRWTRRRVTLVRTVFTLLVGMFPGIFQGSALTVADFRLRLDCITVLAQARHLAHDTLSTLPRPLGFVPPRPDGGGRKIRFQQRMGTDPPAFAG